MLIWLTRSYYRCAYSKEQGCPATKTVQQKESDGNGTVRLFDVDYYDQHICSSDGIVHPYVVEATHDSVPISSQTKAVAQCLLTPMPTDTEFRMKALKAYSWCLTCQNI